MNQQDLENINGKDFRNVIEYFADNNNEYSKEELYDAFVVVTRLYLDELISARQLENAIVSEFGEEAAERFYEELAGSNSIVSEADTMMSFESDPKSVISSQFDVIDKLNEQTEEL